MSGPPNNYQGVRKTRLVHCLLSCIIDQAFALHGRRWRPQWARISFPLVLKLYSEDKVRLEPVPSVQPLKAQQEGGAWPGLITCWAGASIFYIPHSTLNLPVSGEGRGCWGCCCCWLLRERTRSVILLQQNTGGIYSNNLVRTDHVWSQVQHGSGSINHVMIAIQSIGSLLISTLPVDPITSYYW